MDKSLYREQQAITVLAGSFVRRAARVSARTCLPTLPALVQGIANGYCALQRVAVPDLPVTIIAAAETGPVLLRGTPTALTAEYGQCDTPLVSNYSALSNCITLSSNESPFSIPGAFAHEYVHQVQCATGAVHALGLSALAEGHARGIELRVSNLVALRCRDKRFVERSVCRTAADLAFVANHVATVRSQPVPFAGGELSLVASADATHAEGTALMLLAEQREGAAVYRRFLMKDYAFLP